MAVTVSPVPLGNVTQALNTINANFQALATAFNQYLAQTNPVANPATQGLLVPGKITSYNGIATVANGACVPVAYARQTGLTTATPGSAFLSYAIGANGGSFLVMANVFVQASSTEFDFFVTVSATQDAAAIVQAPLQMCGVGYGFLSTTVNDALTKGAYWGIPMYVHGQPNTPISVFTNSAGAHGFVATTYSLEVTIVQVVG